MSSIIPKFNYTREFETDSASRSLTSAKEAFISKKGKITYSDNQRLEIEISSSSLAFAISPFPDLLKIEIRSINDNKIKVEITRAGEKKVAVAMFAIAIILGIAPYIQKGEIKSLVLPIGFYAIMWVYSALPTHPAHKKIREILRFSGE